MNKVTKKNFFEEAGKFHKYFNFGVSDEIAQRPERQNGHHSGFLLLFP